MDHLMGAMAHRSPLRDGNHGKLHKKTKTRLPHHDSLHYLTLVLVQCPNLCPDDDARRLCFSTLGTLPVEGA